MKKPFDCPSAILQLRIGLVKNPHAASKQWREARRLIVARFYSMQLLTRSHNMINHGLFALVRCLWV